MVYLMLVVQHGSTPLMMASSQGHQAVVKVLLAAGCDKKAISKDGVTALNCAASDAIKALLRS